MSVFGNYALYYDLLYKDKDYQSEADYIHKLISGYSSGKSILELGCGTGKHASLLAEKGYTVHGVDISENMLKEAENRHNKLPQNIAERLSFSQGNVCKVRLNRTFDIVISLFHVMSYQTTNDALEQAFSTANQHLKSDSIFIFDCWYGPAVLTERPEKRVKKLENDIISVERIAEPVIYPKENVVDVNYQINITSKESLKTEQLLETHKMRYLFKPEIEYFLNNNGFNLVHSEEWLTGKEPCFDTWGVCFVGVKK